MGMYIIIQCGTLSRLEGSPHSILNFPLHVEQPISKDPQGARKLHIELWYFFHPGGLLVSFFCWVCAAVLSEPLAHSSLLCGQLQTPPQSLLGKCNILSHFLFVHLSYKALQVSNPKMNLPIFFQIPGHKKNSPQSSNSYEIVTPLQSIQW